MIVLPVFQQSSDILIHHFFLSLSTIFPRLERDKESRAQGRGFRNCALSYPLTPPRVMPLTKLFWIKGYTMTMGRTPTTAMAIRTETAGMAARP